MGLEVIETVANPSLSEGNQFIYVENFTGTGLSVETKFNNYVDLQLRVINGWDQVSDNNSHKSFMGRVGLYPDALTSLGVVGYWGAEEPGNIRAWPGAVVRPEVSYDRSTLQAFAGKKDQVTVALGVAYLY